MAVDFTSTDLRWENTFVKESPVSPFLHVLNFGIASMRRSRVSFTPLGLLTCCLFICSLDAPDASAQATSLSSDWAGPVEPADWKLEEWKNKYRLKYSQALKADRLGTEERALLTRGVEYYLYSMTAESPPEPLIELRRRLMTELRSPITKDAAREYLLSEIVRVSKGLLDQPPGVRLNIMILLAGLSTNHTPQDPIPFEPANEVLLTVLNDPDQLVQCKIWSAIGLARISRDGNPNITLKSRIAVDLVKALDSPEAKNSDNWWYRMRLIDAIGDNGEKVNLTQDPVAINALIKIIADPQEHWIIRSSAARAITQLKSDSQTNIPLVAHEICKLGHQMAQAYNQPLAQANKDTPKEAPYWRFCFTNWYLAFQPRTAAQKQRGWGLLQQAGAQNRAMVQEAYQASLPVINGVMRHKDAEQIPQNAIDGLDTWLKNNVPDNFKVTPASEELKQPASDENTHSAAGSSGSTGGASTEVSDVARSGS
jgi:hypothetical protein